MTSNQIGIDKIEKLNPHVSNYSLERLEKALISDSGVDYGTRIKDYKKENIGGITHVRFWVGWSNLFWICPIVGLLAACNESEQKWQDHYFDSETGVKISESKARQKIAQHHAKRIIDYLGIRKEKLEMDSSILEDKDEEESLSIEDTDEEESLNDYLKIDEHAIHYRPHHRIDKHKNLSKSNNNHNSAIDKKYDLNDTNKFKDKKVDPIFLKDPTFQKNDIKRVETKNASFVNTERNHDEKKTNWSKQKTKIFDKVEHDYYTEGLAKSINIKCSVNEDKNSSKTFNNDSILNKFDIKKESKIKTSHSLLIENGSNKKKAMQLNLEGLEIYEKGKLKEDDLKYELAIREQ
jgi:hypothetical protein